MVNLTSFSLLYIMTGVIPVTQFLDFFEGTPHLRKVDLQFAPLTSGAQNGRLVSLACLEKMAIIGCGSASPLLDHLLIPVGADLKIEAVLPSLRNRDHPPRFLDNLRNFPNFTDIYICFEEFDTPMQFSGPNGQVEIIPISPRFNNTGFVLRSLIRFDMSKVERLKIRWGNSPSGKISYQVLFPMKHLRTLTLHHCGNPPIFVHALHPTMSSSGIMVCPKLEELVILLDEGTLDVGGVIGVVAARASRGAKLKSVRIVGQKQFARIDVMELKKPVFNVECGPEVDGTDSDGDGICDKG
jgi:hypothetical protein